MAKHHSSVVKHNGLAGVPWASLLLVLVQALVWSWERRALNVNILGFLIDDYDFVWSAFVENPWANAPRLISHIFFHANVDHFLSNAVFFLLFGPTVERKLGSLLFLNVYFLWGICACLVQGVFSPFSPGLIGASGAISGAAGAFFVLYPLKAPPRFLGLWLGPWIRKIPAFFWIGLWFLDQTRRGFLSLMPEQLADHVDRVGYWAHIGGFAAGALTMIPLIFQRGSDR